MGVLEETSRASLAAHRWTDMPDIMGASYSVLRQKDALQGLQASSPEGGRQ